MGRGRWERLKGSPPIVVTLFYWDSFDEDLVWKTEMGILPSSSLRKLVQVHLTVWILFRETEGSRDKHTSWRPLDLDKVASAPAPHLYVLIWENPGSLCQEPSQPVKKSWSCGILCEWFICWVFLNFVSVAWVRNCPNVNLRDFEDLESGFGRPVCFKVMANSPLLSWKLYYWRSVFLVCVCVCQRHDCHGNLLLTCMGTAGITPFSSPS